MGRAAREHGGPLPGRRAVVLLLAPVVLGACGSPAAAPSPPLQVSLEQSRDNENRHLVQVVLDNPGQEELDVVRLQLRGGGFTDVAPTVREDVLRAGRRLAFPVAYGAADCRRTTPARVVVGHRVDGALREVVLDVPDDDPLLPRLRGRECDLAGLADAATLSFDEASWERTGLVATGRLVVRRQDGREPVELASAEGTVVFTLDAGRSVPAVLTDEPRLELPVRVEATRCDVHALIEIKRSYDFQTALRLGDAELLTVTVTPGPRGLALLEDLLADTCRPA